jgi:hypothetical protein
MCYLCEGPPALASNEFLSERYNTRKVAGGLTLGEMALEQKGLVCIG